MTDSKILHEKILWFQENFTQLQKAASTVIVGQEEVVKNTLIAFLAQGHVLLEGLPGLGKTLLVQTLSQIIGMSYKRIQFTPDLMPADILGTHVLTKNREGINTIQYEKGPVFSDLLLADEINRATPRTQSALLEAMQEKKVTIAGTSHRLPEDFMVIATQNPIEMEGTYPLPEAQLDRFFCKLVVSLPSLSELMEIAQKTTSGGTVVCEQKIQLPQIHEMKQLVPQVCIADHLMKYSANFILHTHPSFAEALPVIRQYVQYGASPRGLQAIVLGAKVHALLRGRSHVSQEDIHEILVPTLRHRILLSFQGEAQGVNSVQLIDQIEKSLQESQKR